MTMNKVLRLGANEYRIIAAAGTSPAASPGPGELRLKLASLADARAFARALADRPTGRADVQRIVAAVDAGFGVHGSPDAAIERMAVLVQRGAIEVHRLPRPAEFDLRRVERERPPPKPVDEEKSWVEIVVVEEHTGKPVPEVKLTITLPDGSTAEHRTSAEGMVSLEGLKPGSCLVVSDLKGAKRSDALAVVHLGSTLPDAKPDPEERRGAKKKKKAPARRRIGRVDLHRVRTGDTLASLAEKVGITWQELAKLNWDTDDPKEINRRLRWDVGCTHRTADGANYRFDDTDDPGLVLLPLPLSSHVQTGFKHVLQVAPLDMKTWRFSL